MEIVIGWNFAFGRLSTTIIWEIHMAVNARICIIEYSHIVHFVGTYLCFKCSVENHMVF